MKIFFALLLLIPATQLSAQHADCATTSFTINGDITSAVTVTGKTLDSFTVVAIPDFVIKNHKGEVRKTATLLKGVLLKDILQKAEINSDSPKLLSEFYYVFTACDGYKVVYSWNEIFNTVVGNNIYILTEKDGAAGENIKDGMVTLCTADQATGRRFVKGLANISVQRVK